jgi:broad specificity phosphatase PhoE
MRRILLVRHGQSEGNVEELKYKNPGDPLVELTNQGWQQAYDAGKFLRWYYRNNPSAMTQGPAIWSSTFMRTRQTTQAVLKGLQWEDRPVREDLRLVEQSYGSTCWSVEEEHAKATQALSEEVYRTNRFLTPLPNGESLMNQFMRVDSFLNTLHRKEAQNAEDDVLIISHGATMKNFLMRWFHIPDYQWKQLDTPHNCDVIAIEHDGVKWRARKIYDGEDRHIALRDPFERLKPLAVPGPRVELK